METWAENLRIIRKNRGLTQLELADKADVARSTIIAYEKGEAQPSMMILQKMAVALGISYQLFFVESKVFLNQLLESDTFSDRRNEFIEFDSLGSRKHDLLQAFNKLNEIGQIEAIKRVIELTEIARYSKFNKEQEG